MSPRPTRPADDAQQHPRAPDRQELEFRPKSTFSGFRSGGKRCGRMKRAAHRDKTRGRGHRVVVEDSLPGTRHRNQHISQTDRVFFDIAEVEEALMAGATLPAIYDARAFAIVVQQLGVGHIFRRSG